MEPVKDEMKDPTITDIYEASNYLKGKIENTPLLYSKTFSNLLKAQVYFKLENFQKTGSFKSRGALFKISKLTEKEKDRGVIACSAGNHAQGVAFAATTVGVKSTIVMPTYTISAKVNAVRNYGADIILKGESYVESFSIAKEISEREGKTFIDGFNDRWIISGQGTIGLEIIEKLDHPDMVVVPVGGGGLISGISTAIKSTSPDTKIIGVQSSNCDCVIQSLNGIGKPSSKGFTIADGIAVQNPGYLNISIIKKNVDSFVTVNDEEMAYSLFKLLERQKIVVEPSGAAPLAAALSGKIDVKGKTVVFVVSGGNIDLLLLSKIIYKGLETDLGLVRIECKIPDRPGTLEKITNVIASANANIFHAEVDNLSKGTPPGYQSITFSINVRDREHLEMLLDKLREKGYIFTITDN